MGLIVCSVIRAKIILNYSKSANADHVKSFISLYFAYLCHLTASRVQILLLFRRKSARHRQFYVPEVTNPSCKKLFQCETNNNVSLQVTCAAENKYNIYFIDLHPDFKGSFYDLNFKKSIFLFLHFSIDYIFKNIKQKVYYMEQGSLIKCKWLLFTIIMFRKLQTRFSRNNVFAIGAHDFLKSFQPITFKISTFILKINIYGVDRRFLKFFILS